MAKTSVYLDDRQRAGLADASSVSGRSQSDLIREGVDHVIQSHLGGRPAMKARAHAPGLVDRIDEVLLDLGRNETA